MNTPTRFRLVDYLKSDQIIILEEPLSPKQIIEKLLAALCRNYDVVLTHQDEIFEAILIRESVASTGIGKEVAIPHGRSLCLDDIYISFARIENGVDWKSSDSKDVKFVFLVIGPQKAKAEEYLQILSQISKLVSRKQTKEAIVQSTNQQEILDVMKALKSRQNNTD